MSYGQLVGRVDALLWYVIGVCAYHRYAGDGQMRLMRGEGITNSGGSRSITMGSCTFRWAVNTWRGARLRAYWHTRQFGAGEIRCLFDMPAYGC